MNEKVYHKIFAIDFDGTIVQQDLSHWITDVSELVEIPGALSAIKAIQKAKGYFLLYTCRTYDNGTLQPALEFLKRNGIIPNAINENVSAIIIWGTSVKPYADVYVDDRSFPPFTNWSDFMKAFF